MATKLLFVDESGDNKFKDYLGVCVAVVDSTKYPLIKKRFHKTLLQHGWDPDVEFKGSYLFSASKGDPNIDVQTRIKIAEELLGLNVSKSNARIRFRFETTRVRSGESEAATYLSMLPRVLRKALPPQAGGAGKNLVSVFADERSDVRKQDLRVAVQSAVHERGYELLEDVVTAQSNFHTVGVLFADLVAYLAARIDNISSDAELFQELPNDPGKENSKLRKLESSMQLVSRIKQLDWAEAKVGKV